MLVLTWKLRPAIRQALAPGLQEAERLQEVAMSTREARDLDGIRRDFGIASLAIVDLGHIAAADVLHVIGWQLEMHPFVPVDLIAGTAVTSAEQRLYFELGKAGVQHMHMPDEAAEAAFWTQRLSDLRSFDLIARIMKDLNRILPPTPAGVFLSRVLDFHASASVKSLADKMYPGTQHTAAYKRRLLWQECKSHGYVAPELVLAAIRLRVLKAVLDAHVWTYDRVARHFGFDTARHLNRSCRNRYGLSVTAIRKASVGEVSELADRVFWESTSPEDVGDN